MILKKKRFWHERHPLHGKCHFKLDPVGSTVRYEMIKLCTGVSIGHYEAVAVGNRWCRVSRGH